jgi:hypothetical protein
MFLGNDTSTSTSTSSHLHNQRTIYVTFGAWQIVFTGRYDTAVSATGFNVVLLRIIGCAWLRAGELAVCGKDGCAKGCMPMEKPQ